MAIDLEAIWQEHKRFIVKVGVGALVFSIGLAWRSSVAAEAARLSKQNTDQQAALQDDLGRLEGAEGLEKGRAEALGAKLEPAILKALMWRPEAGFTLPAGEKSPELFYSNVAARAAADVQQAAQRWNASIPQGSQGLGLAVQPSTEDIPEALGQADLHRRLALRLLDAGVRTITEFDAGDAGYDARDGAEGAVRELRATVRFQASTAMLAKALAEVQVDGSFVEVVSCKVERPQGRVPGGLLDIELEVQALQMVDKVPASAARGGPRAGGLRPSGPRRPFGKER
jgi:hypothetical protein